MLYVLFFILLLFLNFASPAFVLIYHSYYNIEKTCYTSRPVRKNLSSWVYGYFFFLDQQHKCIKCD